MPDPNSLCKASAVTRRNLLGAAAAGASLMAISRQAFGAVAAPSQPAVPIERRFPHFRSHPVSYFKVRMGDTFWAPRQKTVREVSVGWATGHMDRAGGLLAYRASPATYRSDVRRGDLEAIKMVEAMAAVAGVQRSADIEGLARGWGTQFIAGHEPDGYWSFGWPNGADPAKRWKAVWWSHEDYALGHYLESALAIQESTGETAMLASALRGIDRMADDLLGSGRAYAPGHQEIEQALTRLYAATGNTRYLELCGWLIGQRGHHEGRPSFGKYSQDHLPFEEQRTIEGHAVRAGFFYNGVAEYVGATGHEGYRQALLAIWDDFVQHKMYLHGGGGLKSTRNEGYSSTPDHLPPDDCYGESCSVFANFQWAHNLFRLTGEARYLDVAERMLYNAFYASLSLQGDRYFYENAMEKNEPVLRFPWHFVPCCPPNIVKLFSKVGGYFYETDSEGVYVKHYGATEADIPFGNGVKLVQRGNYPWDGTITIGIECERPLSFAMRLRLPEWTRSHQLAINGKAFPARAEKGWLIVERRWRSGDEVRLELPMPVERVTMPERFADYRNLVALQRGPLVYCLEQQDLHEPIARCSLQETAAFSAEHKSDLLGGATVIDTELVDFHGRPVAARFIPYALWNNRGADQMRVWIRRNVADSDSERAIQQAIPVNPPGV